MGLSNDLLEIAGHLAQRDRTKPKQANLRRAISSAYYALFHLLVENATRRWRGSRNARSGLSRAFDHSKMRQACGSFAKQQWIGFDGRNLGIPVDLQNIATIFRTLQNLRHEADYNPMRNFTRSNVQILVFEAEQAFTKWDSISSSPIADSFLVALLTGDRRRD